MNNSLLPISLLIFVCCTSQLIGQNSFLEWFEEDKQGRLSGLKEKMDETGTPGLSIYISQNGREHIETIGHSSSKKDAGLKSNTIFPVGAMSLAPLLLEILRLENNGLLNLNDPLTKHIPELKDKRWFKGAPFTIRDLVLYRKKINGPYKPKGYSYGQVVPTINEFLQNGNQDFPNGIQLLSNNNKSKDSKSTVGLVLQIILQRIHQKSLNEIIQENIFERIGLTNSFYASELTKEQSIQAAIGNINGKPIQNGHYNYTNQGAMGLWTTPTDYAKLIQHVIDIYDKGKKGIVTQRQAKSGLFSKESYHSYIFNTSPDGTIYGGGNSKGFYTSFSANPTTGFIQVWMANADLVWPLVNGNMWKTEGWFKVQNSKNKVQLLTQSKDEKTNQELENHLKTFCRKEGMKFIKTPIEEVPQLVTATPAIIFSNEKGWSIYGGQINQYRSINSFIKQSISRPIIPRSIPLETPILVHSKGRQKIGLKIKLTTWNEPQISENWKPKLEELIRKEWNASESKSAFYPTDRKFYLDIHPYKKRDSVYLSMAIFSQFDCINPIFNNFANPLVGIYAQSDNLISKVVALALRKIEELSNDRSLGIGLSPVPLASKSKPYSMETKVEPTSTISTGKIEEELVGTWNKINTVSDQEPMIQFNFPQPLERYSGNINKMSGNLEISNENISGKFIANLKSLVMGSKSLNKKVFKDYLKISKFSEASFKFENAKTDLIWNQQSSAEIIGVFEMLGKEIPLITKCQFTPNEAKELINITVEFRVNIKEVFELPGPDGPKEASENIDFFMQFKLSK